MLATGLASGLPIVVSTVKAVAGGEVPLADEALIAVKAYDVLSANSPLLGPLSSGYSTVVGEPVFHPGPLLFWLYALPVRLPWPEALALAAGLVNLASVMGVVALARRRGGPALMLATAVAIPVMLASLPSASFSDIWNPSAPTLPFLALVFIGWSLACGEHRLLPLAVLIASFVVQCHLGYLVAAAATLAVGVAGLALSRRAELLRAPARAWMAGALVVGVVCWSAPAIDQVTNDPGNLRLVYRAIRADQPTLGLDPAWRAVVHTVGVVPWWLEDPHFGISRAVDLGQRPSAVARASAVLALAALAALALLGWRRRRPDVVAATVLALALCAAVAVVAGSTPQHSVGTLAYSLRWASPVGLFAWLALGWSAATLLAPARLRAPLPAPRRLAPALGLALVAVVAAVVAASGDLRDQPYGQTTAIAEGIESGVPDGRPIVLGIAGPPDATFMALSIQAGVLYALRLDGRDVAAGSAANYLGPKYRPQGGEQVVRIDIDTPPPEGGRLLARLAVLESPDPEAPGPQAAARRRQATVTAVP